VLTSPPMPQVDSASRIVVLRALQLGDMLCAVPALRALRRANPHAHIALVALPWARELAGRFPEYIDELIEFPGFPGLPERAPEIAAVPRFLAEMQARRFDLALQAHGSGQVTNAIAALFGARRTAGCYAPGAWCPDDESFIPYPDDEPERRRPLRLLEHLGVACGDDALEFPVRPADRAELAALRGGPPGARIAVIHAGARQASRRWPAARFAETADALAARGCDIVLTGSTHERAITAGVRARMRAPATDLAGRTTLGSLAALLESARLLVCNDTGVSHLADALRTPSVVVFSGSDPTRWAPADAALHRPVAGVDVAVQDVLREADALLGREAADAA
jgi:ADP-heptose:LPS heptosyltransferase